MLVAVGFSPLVVNTTVSPSKAAVPLALKTAPPVAELLSQPRPALEGGLLHGQGKTPATPGLQ
jgi:ABC-type methionine transport system permease subunit